MDSYTTPDWPRSALLTIDVQKDFTRPGASAYISGTEQILQNLQKLLKHFRQKQRPVFHIIRLYRRDGANVDLCRRAAVENGNQIVAPGTDGAELVDELKPNSSISMDHDLLLDGQAQPLSPNEWALYKPRWGAFYQTDLEERLHVLDVNTVVVAGCNFPNCPRTTLYEASERDFRTVLVRDAVSGLYDKGEEELRGIGTAVLESGDIIGASS